MGLREDVTLGIPCYNEAGTLEGTLDAIAGFDARPARVLCVDDGSTDGTAGVVRDHPQAELLLHDENRGRGAARNTLLAATETPLLATIDADVRPRPGWLAALSGRLDATGAAAVGGRVVESVRTGADRWRAVRMSVNDYDEAGEVPRIAGGNALFRTAAVRAVGGWPDLQSNEDLKLCKRLRAADHEVHYTPAAVVDHVRTDTAASVLRTLWSWHFASRNEPDSLVDVLRRIPGHAAKGSKYVGEDLLERRWWAVPISARLPLQFLREDLRRTRREGGTPDR